MSSSVFLLRFLMALTLALACTAGVGAQEVVLSYDSDLGEIPVGIAVDKVGNIWVSLQSACEVRRYSPDWVETAVVEIPCSEGAVGTGGIAVDATGMPYVTVISPDDDERGVWMLDLSGPTDRVPGTEQMIFPNSIAFDHHNGTMYVTDTKGGSIYRVPKGGEAEWWTGDGVLAGVPPDSLGANGIVVQEGHVVVAVTFFPRLVRIPIEEDGSAGPPEVPYDTFSHLFPASVFALDDIALDVFGNVYAAVVAGMPTVAQLAGDGSGITPTGFLPASPVTLAFGTGKGARKTLFVGFTDEFGPSPAGISGIAELPVEAPGRPIP